MKQRQTLGGGGHEFMQVMDVVGLPKVSLSRSAFPGPWTTLMVDGKALAPVDSAELATLSASLLAPCTTPPSPSPAPSFGPTCDPLATKRSAATPLGANYEVVRSSEGVLYVVDGSRFDLSLRVFVEENGELVRKYVAYVGGMMDGPGGGSWTITLYGETKLVYAGEKLTTLVMPDGSTSPLVAENSSAVADLPVTDAPSRYLMHDMTQLDGSRLVLISEQSGAPVPNYHLFYGTPPRLQERPRIGIASIETGIQPEFMVDGVKHAAFLPNANATTADSKPPQERLAGLQFQCL